ncbi:HNH endonuclease [Candidatus Woesearchaeota archaeon CG_4_10_14_0_2_um_filter_33_10]|nr:MAG: HNH endonuclease [Candidatus Woesearchaeota archaeon CG06_land_8_20_14_3_00_33_13]PIZ52145.1 MAG: HNH endonuclease [Candidatus Woesearchaeota archaeon CG_4_10_14_0_2_um_filter_33_10]
MQVVQSVVFRKITDADFFNINKPAGIEVGGGGQSYIDFPTSGVTLQNWNTFLRGITPIQFTQGSSWEVPILSLGADTGTQRVKIYQRRANSVSIASQKIRSSENNRVHAWRPDLTGFPQPADPSVRIHIENLHVYIAKLDNGEYWAGWFQAGTPEPDWAVNRKLNRMFTENAGYIEFNGEVLFDTSDPAWAFKVIPRAEAPPSLDNFIGDSDELETEPEEEISDKAQNSQKVFFDEDEEVANDAPAIVKELMRKVRIRNTKAVRKLKELYQNICQISGEQYAFKKRNGKYYSEGHHLILLGQNGSDSARNIVIINPLIHRKLHYANVEGLDLKKIKDNKLTFKINGEEYTITWHPEHAKIVTQFN